MTVLLQLWLNLEVEAQMFFKFIKRNVVKNRKNNGLFFGSLIIAIIAFYTLLSLGDQDVIKFLRKFESYSVEKLLNLIPIVYIISLFFVFFLVYFAYSYQLDSRKKEFGLYLMHGMKRSTLFGMLMGETIVNSIISILIGLPITILLTELISLITAKVVGFGIIGHKISISTSAILGTVGGFILVQVIAMLILSIQINKKEPKELLDSDSADKQKTIRRKSGGLNLIIGILVLLSAYFLGVVKLRVNYVLFLPIFILGVVGTFLLFRGLGVLIGHYIRNKSSESTGLFTFTGRQIQEHVIHQYKELAISSLLLFIAIACVSFGIGIVLAQVTTGERTVDYSVYGTEKNIREALETDEAKSIVNNYYPVYVEYMNTDTYNLEGEKINNKKDAIDFNWGNMSEVFSAEVRIPEDESYLERFKDKTGPYIISLSTYNQLLKTIDEEPLKLESNQVAFYSFLIEKASLMEKIDMALKKGIFVNIDKQRYNVVPQVEYRRLFAGSELSLFGSLIVPDELYKRWTVSDKPYCWNIVLKRDLVEKMGYIETSDKMDIILGKTDLVYGDILKGESRKLFYAVTAGYITLYLGSLFMVIANTVIGIKYLIQQRTDRHRYITLLKMGATIEKLSNSARSQIRIFFLIAILLAICNSVFAVWSMFVSFLRLPVGTPIKPIIIFIILTAVTFIIIECIYIYLVERASDREIRELEMIKRGVTLE